ncbi:MAG: hypothetical protein CFE31_09820 [Rhizobiales bacterium PAR1]|nr:MAG: hypothetical protein CFE31_09820 [Rhizobiales bacterium PAR1]
MSLLQSLYRTPVLLTPEWGHERIFSPQSYEIIRKICTVPVALHEASTLARNFALCWQKDSDRVRLVALVSLLPEALAFPAYQDLPLILQAYPVVVRPNEAGEPLSIWVDKTIPDKPTDIGAPILMDNHKLSSGAELRIRAALHLRDTFWQADDLTDDLLAHGILETWPLKFDLGYGQKLERDDLLVVASDQRDNPALYSIVQRHGLRAGLFMGLHRASLFRVNWLLMQARNHLRTQDEKARREEQSQSRELFR